MGWFLKDKQVETPKTANSEERDETVNIVNMASLGLNLYRAGSNGALALSAFYACVELISNSIASLPIQIKHRKKDQVVEFNDAYDLGYHNKFLFIKNLVSDMLLYGNGFAHITRDGSGNAIGLRYLEAGDVNVMWNKNTNTLYYTCPIVAKGAIDPHDMLHVYKNSYDGITGIGVAKYASRLITSANNAENSASDFYAKGMNMSALLHATAPMTKAQATQAVESMQGSLNTNGNSNFYKFIPFDIKLEPFSMNAQDAQLNQTREFNIAEIARYFNMPVAILTGSTNSAEQTNLQFLTNCLMPYIAIIEEECQKKLISQKNKYIDIDERTLIRTDLKSNSEYLNTLVSAGIMTINEARETLGYSEIEGGDKPIIPYTDVQMNTVDGQKKEEEGNGDNIDGNDGGIGDDGGIDGELDGDDGQINKINNND